MVSQGHSEWLLIGLEMLQVTFRTCWYPHFRSITFDWYAQIWYKLLLIDVLWLLKLILPEWNGTCKQNSHTHRYINMMCVTARAILTITCIFFLVLRLTARPRSLPVQSLVRHVSLRTPYLYPPVTNLKAVSCLCCCAGHDNQYVIDLKTASHELPDEIAFAQWPVLKSRLNKGFLYWDRWEVAWQNPLGGSQRTIAINSRVNSAFVKNTNSLGADSMRPL